MPLVTLLEKGYGPSHPETFQPQFATLCKGLKVTLKGVGTTDRGWIQLDLTGEDAAVASRFLDQEVGLAPGSIDRLEKISGVRRRMIFSARAHRRL